MIFGRKKKQLVAAEAAKPAVAVTAIPPDFYAGKNPEVTWRTVPTSLDWQRGHKLTAAEKAALDRATAAGAGRPLHPVHWLANRRRIIVVAGGLLVLFSAGAAWYYFSAAPPPVAPPPLALVPVAATPAVEPAPPPEPEPTPAPAAPEAAPRPPRSAVEFPPTLLGDTFDADSDGLTDAEEELFTSDPGVPDSDADSYPDSHEVYNLYNPVGKEPIKIIESGLVKEFTNPVFGYRVYYPNTWAMGNVDQNYQTVLFSTLTGENIEIAALERGAGELFADWFARFAPAEKYQELLEFKSVFKETGFRRGDYLVYYFSDPRYHYVLAYHGAAATAAINYRTVIKMMARSFRLVSNTEPLPVPATESPTALPTPEAGPLEPAAVATSTVSP